MALKKEFKQTQAKRRGGMLEEIVEGFYRWLLKHGFSQERVQKHILNIEHFDAYLARQNTSPLKIISSKDVDTFLKGYPLTRQAQERGKTHILCVNSAVGRFVEYLSEAGLFNPLLRMESYQPILDAYLEWMRTYRHVTHGTIGVCRRSLTKFLIWLGPKANVQNLSKLSPEEVERFFLQYAQGIGRSGRRSMQATLRTFFRFCLSQGYIQYPLDQAVPELRTYKLATLPRGLTEEQAQKILQCPDRHSDVGRRDYAILQLLYTYGVRCGQVKALRLTDINWAENQILFKASKHGKDSLLPLTTEVGESLLDYLQHARPHYAYPEVFLTCCAPYRPLANHGLISGIVRRRIETAGIDIPYKGAHIFRHGFATRMLQKGNSLKSIADVLGHRLLQTTFIYTKVDFNALNQVALQWPLQVKQ